MPHFTLRQLECFSAAIDHGSFAAAAAELRVSATAVAAAVTALETALGVQLCIRRKSHGIEATPTGSFVLGEARALLRDAEEIEHATRPRSGPLRGPVSLGCYSTLAPTILPGLAASFEAIYPGLDVTYREGPSDELIDLLMGGRLDVVLAYRLNLPDGLDEAVLYETSVHALLPADHPLARSATVSLSQLSEEPLIMLDLLPGNRHALDMLYEAGITPRVRHRSRSLEVVRSMVARGLGYSLLVQRPLIDHSYEGLPLVAVPIEPVAPVTAVLLWRSGMRVSSRARALIDFAKSSIRHPPYSAGLSAAGTVPSPSRPGSPPSPASS